MLKTLLEAIKTWGKVKNAKGEFGKRWLFSNTLWVNIFLFLGVVSQQHLGLTLSAEETNSLIIIVNLVLRASTKTPVGFIDHK